ncbi:hypothetical protein G7046_g6195 [Stylonectria norvegica]|nr:hypothetical protein G7046_g6195 [Stylonectria norvegica]
MSLKPTDLLHIRARQIQRYYHASPARFYRENISSADLKRAALLEPKYALDESPDNELLWPEHWDTLERSLKTFLSGKTWRELPEEQAVVDEPVAVAVAASNQSIASSQGLESLQQQNLQSQDARHAILEPDQSQPSSGLTKIQSRHDKRLHYFELDDGTTVLGMEDKAKHPEPPVASHRDQQPPLNPEPRVHRYNRNYEFTDRRENDPSWEEEVPSRPRSNLNLDNRQTTDFHEPEPAQKSTEKIPLAARVAGWAANAIFSAASPASSASQPTIAGPSLYANPWEDVEEEDEANEESAVGDDAVLKALKKYTPEELARFRAWARHKKEKKSRDKETREKKAV